MGESEELNEMMRGAFEQEVKKYIRIMDIWMRSQRLKIEELGLKVACGHDTNYDGFQSTVRIIYIVQVPILHIKIV